VKKDKINEIKNYIATATAEETKHQRIFDVTTAIDVCREHKATRDQAITCEPTEAVRFARLNLHRRLREVHRCNPHNREFDHKPA